MSQSTDSSCYGNDPTMASFPVHHEITLPSNDIITEADSESAISVIELPKHPVDDFPQYAQIDIQTDSETAPVTKSPTSIYALGGSSKKPKLELKPREVSTRQCKFDIGEEWEQFQTWHNKSISCPPSPLGGRKGSIINAHDNSAYAASEPGAEIDQDLTDGSQKEKDPFSFHFLFSSHPRLTKDKSESPNPFNNINHRFHSTLQCPCFLFFFFLCCIPAVHFMQESDNRFKEGDRRHARTYGRLSTAAFVVGTILGVAFLAMAIYFATGYVKQFL